nr:tetratricopeptide repeat protein [Candidatus Baldrarchaeota archaeon]
MKYFKVIRSVNELVGDEGLWRLPSYVVDEYVLDEPRTKALETAVNSITVGNNVLIIGSPGTGKTAFMLILLKRLLEEGFQVGVILEGAASISRSHEETGIILFYDDLPRIRREALLSIFRTRAKNIVATARTEEVPYIQRTTGEDPWNLFNRIEIPGMKPEDLRKILIRYTSREGIKILEDEATDVVVEKAQGLPVYIWQLVRELKIKKSDLTVDFARQIPQGMFDYVDDILWRVLGEHPERYEVLITLLCMADMLRYAVHQDLYNAIFVTAKKMRTGREYRLEEALFSDLLDNITRYLAREGISYTFRLPHDSWGDVLKGRSSGPMSGEISRVNTIYPSRRRRRILVEAARRAWNEVLKISEDESRKQKFIENLRNNFTEEELAYIGVLEKPVEVKGPPTLSVEDISFLTGQLRSFVADPTQWYFDEKADDAIRIAEQVITHPKADKDALNLAAVAFLKRWRETRDEYLLTIAENTLHRVNTAKAWYNLGLAYYEEGDYMSAIKAYEWAIKKGMSKKDADVYYNLALAYIKAGKIKEGVKALEEYVKRKPEDKKTKEILERIKRPKKK